VDSGRFADDKASNLRHRWFSVLCVDSVVSDQRVGHRHELASVRRVSKNLLIPTHTGVEYDLTKSKGLGTKKVPIKAASIF